jgi:hypothetical protein
MSSYSYYIRNKYNNDSDLNNFCDWMDEVEEIVKEETGYNILELPDQTYRYCFEDDVPAESAAYQFIDDWKINGDI